MQTKRKGTYLRFSRSVYMTLGTLLSELHYKKEIELAVLQKIRKDERTIEKISDFAYHGEDLNFSLCGRMPLTRLAVVTYLLLRKYDDYRAKGIPDKVIFDTFRDVSLRAKLYYDRTGKIGISKEDVIWFRRSTKRFCATAGCCISLC